METLHHMRSLAARAANDDGFRRQARIEWAGNVTSTIRGVDSFVRLVFRYRPESEELLKDPLLSMQEISERGWFDGDCDDSSMFTAALLKTFLANVRFVAIRYKQEDPEFQHVYVEAWTPEGVWEKLDATVEPGTEIKELERIEEYV
jgi:hypothetical protein